MDVSFDHPNVQLIQTATENGCMDNTPTRNDMVETKTVNTNANLKDMDLSKNVISDIEKMSSLNTEMGPSSRKDSCSSVKEIKGADGVRPLMCAKENNIPSIQIIPENENSIKTTNGPKTDVVIELVDTVAPKAINDNSIIGDDKKLTGSCAIKSHPILSSIVEGETSKRSRTSLPVKKVNVEERSPNTGKRRNTNPSLKLPNKIGQPLTAKDVDIRRIMSNERQSTRSGFGGTADSDGTKPSLTPPERLKLQLKSGKKPHPLIILPDNGHFWCDPPQSNMSKPKYFLSCFDMEKQWKEIYGDDVDIVINPSETAADAYVSNFSQNDHYNFCGIEPTKGPIAVSVKSNNMMSESLSDPNMKNRKSLMMRRTSSVQDRSPLARTRSSDTTFQLEVIISLVEGSEYHKITETFDSRVSGAPAYLDLIKSVKPDMNLAMLQHVPTKNSVDSVIQYHDFKDAAIKNHKFGLIYQPVGDTTEKELFKHYQHSERMEKFLLMLGTKVNLSAHSGYFGGLHNFVKEIEENEDQDRVKGGSHSLYTEHDNKGVMFHVSTLLPTTIDGTDDQQIEKKKRIGNDMVCIIFQDGDTPFTPDLIPSQFLNCYIVVRPLEGENEGKYKVVVTARSEISNSTPVVPESGIFEGGPEFRQWLLDKLVAMRRICYQTERFRKIYLTNMVQMLTTPDPVPPRTSERRQWYKYICSIQ